MTGKGTPAQFKIRAEACELAAAHLRDLAHENKVNAREFVKVAQWIERRGFWWLKKIPVEVEA